MVRASKAAFIAGLSALGVGIVHFAAHRLFSALPPAQQLWAVGAAVVLSTFLIAFVGMVI